MTRHTIFCPDLSEYSIAISSPVQFRESVEIPTFEQVQLDLFHALWDEIHIKENPTIEWFASWCSRVPNFSGCGCGDFLQDYCIANPPRFDDWPSWSWELHNAVNVKVGRSLFSWVGFLSRYPRQQSPITDLIAVTSLAPHRLERQSIVLDNWMKFGLKIVSVNTYEEFERIEKDYPQVSAWMHSPYDCKTQRINSLLDVSTRLDLPVLLINSDIEIYGEQSRLIDLVRARKSAIGIRHNYDVQPGDAKQEMWGLDAFLVYPEQVQQFHRTDFAIGVPMWDWWLPWELNRVGAESEWIDEPFFFHQNHQQTWSDETCVRQKAYFSDRFGVVDFIKWRQARSFEGC